MQTIDPAELSVHTDEMVGIRQVSQGEAPKKQQGKIWEETRPSGAKGIHQGEMSSGGEDDGPVSEELAEPEFRASAPT